MTVFGCEVTAPQGSKEESQAQNNVIEKTAEYIVSREVPVVGEVLLAIDLAKPILDLPNNKEVQQGVLEGLKKRADTGDLKDKKAYENYYKSVMPFHITTDVKVSPAPPWYH